MLDISLDADALKRLLLRETLGVLASVNPDGTPHAAPMWYVVIGEDVYVETRAASRKARNLRARPGFALSVGLATLGPSAMLRGRATEVEDAETRARVRRRTAVRYFGSEDHPSARNLAGLYESMGSSVFRLQVERAVSWDYEKLPAEAWILPQAPPAR